MALSFPSNPSVGQTYTANGRTWQWSANGAWEFYGNVNAHTHGNITNDGAIGSTANLPLITTTSGVVTTGSFGTASATFCQGNDARLNSGYGRVLLFG